MHTNHPVTAHIFSELKYVALLSTVVSRKRAQYQISAHPPLLLQFPGSKVYSKKRRAQPIDLVRKVFECNMIDARLVYSYTENDVI